MKTLNFFVLLFLSFFLLSCDSSEIKLEETNHSSLQKFTQSDIIALKEIIHKSYKELDVQVEKIIEDKKFGSFDIITFLNKNGDIMEIGFKHLFNSDGVLSKTPDYTVYCTGSCGCHLEGIIDLEDNGNSYVQCSCSDCQMHYKTSNKKIKKEKNLIDLARKSYEATFKKFPINLVITKVDFNKYKRADVLTIYYKDDNSEESTFLLVTNYKYEKLTYGASQKIGIKGDFTVDCTGSCDCRERFYPSNGSIECTCSPCSMEVHEVKK